MTTPRPHRAADLPALLELLDEQLGLAYTDTDTDTDLADLPGWDSVHLLRLVMLLERTWGRPVPPAALLEARTLRALHTAALDAGEGGPG